MKRATGRLPMTRAKRFARDDRGVSAIEFALVAPVVIILILGTVEMALDMIVDATVQLAAQQASRVGMTTVNPASGTRDAQARSIVMAYLGRWKNIGGTVTISTYNYGTFGNVGTSNYSSNMGAFGDVVSYNIAVTIPGFSGIPKLFGIKTMTFSRNYLVQNEK
jgi:Flp pilus assembly protein TadG